MSTLIQANIQSILAGMENIWTRIESLAKKVDEMEKHPNILLNQLGKRVTQLEAENLMLKSMLDGYRVATKEEMDKAVETLKKNDEAMATLWKKYNADKEKIEEKKAPPKKEVYGHFWTKTNEKILDKITEWFVTLPKDPETTKLDLIEGTTMVGIELDRLDAYRFQISSSEFCAIDWKLLGPLTFNFDTSNEDMFNEYMEALGFIDENGHTSETRMEIGKRRHARFNAKKDEEEEKDDGPVEILKALQRLKDSMPGPQAFKKKYGMLPSEVSNLPPEEEGKFIGNALKDVLAMMKDINKKDDSDEEEEPEEPEEKDSDNEEEDASGPWRLASEKETDLVNMITDRVASETKRVADIHIELDPDDKTWPSDPNSERYKEHFALHKRGGRVYRGSGREYPDARPLTPQPVKKRAGVYKRGGINPETVATEREVPIKSSTSTSNSKPTQSEDDYLCSELTAPRIDAMFNQYSENVLQAVPKMDYHAPFAGRGVKSILINPDSFHMLRLEYDTGTETYSLIYRANGFDRKTVSGEKDLAELGRRLKVRLLADLDD